MRVLLLSHYPPPAGGIASWTKRVLDLGFPKGWKISHVNLNTIGGRDPFHNPRRKFSDEFKRTATIWKNEVSALRNEKDILLVHTCIPCTPFGMIRETISGIIAKRFGKKFVLHCRCTIPNVVNNQFKKTLLKILLSKCDGVIVLNQKSYDFVVKLTKNPTRIIPNFVTDSEILQESKKVCKKNIQNICYVGGVTSEKGCDTIIEAARTLKQFQFHLVGPISEELQNMPITKNVTLYGSCNRLEVAKILQNADVFLFLSHYWGEGFSNALAEAMAAGLPCVVTDWAANMDMIEKKGGIVIPAQDTNGLKDTLLWLNENEIFRKEASTWNINKVRSSYISDVILPRYVEFYEHVLRTSS